MNVRILRWYFSRLSYDRLYKIRLKYLLNQSQLTGGPRTLASTLLIASPLIASISPLA